MCPEPPGPDYNSKDWGALDKTLRDALWTAKLYIERTWRLRLELNSGRRSRRQQWRLRRGRVPRGQECNPAYKGNPPTAIPGASKHQNESKERSAADMMGSGLGKLHEIQNLVAIHFPVRGENWHAENNLKRKPTIPIIEWPNRGPSAPAPKPNDPNEGRSWIGFAKNVSDAGIYAAGGRNDEVAELQMMLNKVGNYGLKVNGLYYSKSVTAWIDFQNDQYALDRKNPLWKKRSSSVDVDKIAVLRGWYNLLK